MPECPIVKALVTGATGFVGGRLTDRLAEDGVEVRCLVRDKGRARHLAAAGHELHEGDVTRPETLRSAGDGIDVAYYLVHGMGRGASDDFEQQERRSAAAFADMAAREGVARVVYLGGLGETPGSKHLRSRHDTALVLGEKGPPLTYFRAAMVVGAGSESYKTLRYLVQRLPAMIAPAWLKTRTQPIAVHDVLEYLAAAPRIDAAAGREVQIGGPDVLSYGDMLDRMAEALGTYRRPKVPVSAADAAAVVALDRIGHTRGRRRRAPADRGALHGDGRHRSVRRGPVRGRADTIRRCPPRGDCGGSVGDVADEVVGLRERVVQRTRTRVAFSCVPVDLLPAVRPGALEHGLDERSAGSAPRAAGDTKRSSR